MIIRVVILALAVYLLLSFIGFMRKLPPAQRRQALVKYGGYGVLLLVILLAMSGRLHWIGAVIAGIIPFVGKIAAFLTRSLPFLNWLQRQRLKPTQLKSRFLAISIDSKTGVWSGKILDGENAGQNLDELSQEQLIELSHQYKTQDAESARLLNAYMRFRFQQSTNDSNESQTETSSTQLSRKEALAILGLEDSATEKDIIAAHRSLMQKFHPDRGGSDYLAAKINQAKDFLIS